MARSLIKKNNRSAYSLTGIFFLLQIALHTTAQTNSITAANYEIRIEFNHWDSVYIRITIEGKVAHQDSLFGRQILFKGVAERNKEAILEITDGHIIIRRTFYIEPGTITIQDSAKSLIWFKIYGTPLNDQIIVLNHTIDSLFPFKYLPPDEMQKASKLKRDWIKGYFARDPSSVLNTLLFSQNFIGPDISDTETCDAYGLVKQNLRETYGGRMLDSQINRIRGIMVGASAPQFSLPDTSGSWVSSASFRRKFLLLDFWASWCGPCREQIPALKVVAEKYKGEFQIVAISLDRDKSQWKKAIIDENLSWTQLSDLLGWEGPVGRTYCVTAIPANFLVDPQGRIIGKNLTPVEVDQKLSDMQKK